MSVTTRASVNDHHTVLNLVSFLTQLGIALINLALVYHLRRTFGMGADHIGIATSIYTVSYLLACIAGESWSRRFSPRICVEVSLIGMSLSIAAVIYVRSLLFLYVVLALYGVFMSLMWPQIEGWISRGREGVRLNKAMGEFNFSWSFGAGVAPFIGGILVEISTVAALSSGAVFLFFVMCFLFVSSRFIPSMKEVPSEEHAIIQDSGTDGSTPLRYLCWSGLVLVYCGVSVVQTIFPLYAQDVLQIPESMTGALLLVRGITTCGLFYILGRTSWWHFRAWVILGVQVAFSLVCLYAVKITTVWMYIPFFVVFGSVFATAYTMSIFHGASGSVHRARRMMIHEVLLTFGMIIGAASGGFVYEHLGFPTVMLVLAGLGAFAVVMEIIVAIALRGRFTK
ncbi:MFS transporter [Parasphaerochaeta coccoides]|uniref:Major facilitator superfamily MFS_1 n=1 Tax=Parasphaerochaeta coccoides (strain ATCC BAA-1237 / DSM 17374 / SPN1) TaxID=760011 RepID=F4GLJ0_PARC1|nr:MFS transporter [Parasphaerochaeta coccoides]AEC01960.1 major facilitator superfamily MFS_1 [Parasphaerochaeta coccoides DSM 17374]